METDPSNLDGGSKVEQLGEENQRLRESLKACHNLVAEYRSKLAANGNDLLLPSERSEVNDTAGF
jgi:hypothetical protein